MQRESELFITSMITDRIGRHEVLLPTDPKNFNLGEKKNSKLRKEGKICMKTDKGGVKMNGTLKVTLVYLNYNFAWDWLI